MNSDMINEKTRIENRKNNVTIRRIKSLFGGKCCICDKFIDNDTDIVRVKIYGINKKETTICFDCVKYLNSVIPIE